MRIPNAKPYTVSIDFVKSHADTATAKIIFAARKAACFCTYPHVAVSTRKLEELYWPNKMMFIRRRRISNKVCRGRDNIPDVEGRCAATFIALCRLGRDLEISGSLLQQTCDRVRLEARSASGNASEGHYNVNAGHSHCSSEWSNR